ncbi:MAG: hypothetical protein JXR10_17270 [Cyclobacteriaceae bacterium]
MTKRNIYLERYAWPTIGLYEQIINSPELIVVIPAHKESNIVQALESLNACSLPPSEVAIIIIINESQEADQLTTSINQKCLEAINSFDSKYQVLTEYLKLPPKKAGVGLARKIGMDEAARHFDAVEKDGIIISYDADCHSSPNYLSEIKTYFDYIENNVGLVHYEHDLEGENHVAIINYELHLRYYINALRIAKYPNALQTLGSCITVRSSAYQKQGGMNTRKAGEDFYFIHKMVPLGGIGEINTTTVYPSDRTSDRVPFGTGHAIDKFLSNPTDEYPTYNPLIFNDLMFVNQDLKTWYQNPNFQISRAPSSLGAFFKATDFQKSLEKIVAQSGDYENFVNRYYQWWDGFKVLKYVHFARDHYYPNAPLDEACAWVSKLLNINILGKSRREVLLELRRHDKRQIFYIK